MTWVQATNRAEHATMRPALTRRCTTRPRTINQAYQRFRPAPRKHLLWKTGFAVEVNGLLRMRPFGRGESRNCPFGSGADATRGMESVMTRRRRQILPVIQCVEQALQHPCGKRVDFSRRFTRN